MAESANNNINTGIPGGGIPTAGSSSLQNERQRQQNDGILGSRLSTDAGLTGSVDGKVMVPVATTTTTTAGSDSNITSNKPNESTTTTITTSPSVSNDDTTGSKQNQLTDQAVLEYLKSKGMGTAALELASLLEKSKDGEGSGGSNNTSTITGIKPTTSTNKTEFNTKDTTTHTELVAKTTTTTSSTAIATEEVSGTETTTTTTTLSSTMKTTRQQVEEEETISKNQRTLLSRSTGGSYGYDRDSAWPIVQWGIPDIGRTTIKKKDKTTTTTTTPITTASNSVVDTDVTMKDVTSTDNVIEIDNEVLVDDTIQDEFMGDAEARVYVNGFVALQLWVLSLPDEEGVVSVNDPIYRANELLQTNLQSLSHNNNTTSTKRRMKITDQQQLVQTILKEIIAGTVPVLSSSHGSTGSGSQIIRYNFPPSAKNELMAITFALLVHTYCELLEHGMEVTAHSLRDAFRCIYEPYHPTYYQDLYQCITKEDIMRINIHNSKQTDLVSTLNYILVQIASSQAQRDELILQASVDSNSSSTGGQQQQQNQQTQQEINGLELRITQLRRTYEKETIRANNEMAKVHDVPFLRRARAARWQLSISTTTYSLLSSFLMKSSSSGTTTSIDATDSVLRCMSTLLQTRCEIHVEKRLPLPFVPACVLHDEGIGRILSATTMAAAAAAAAASSLGTLNTIPNDTTTLNDNVPISWTAPAPRLFHECNTISKLAFAKYHLDDEYETEQDAAIDTERITFNRALLINGFRRLEALERKREYEALPSAATKRLRNTASITNGSTDNGNNHDTNVPTKLAADPFDATILVATLSSASATHISTHTTQWNKKSLTIQNKMVSSGPTSAITTAAAQRRNNIVSELSSIWEEAGIGMCCAKLSPPDGRHVAVGCEDAAIRIWSALDGSLEQGDEPLQVLLGHKNGFPVFDLDWNRDGRTLLSCGGDGSIRLWDTGAVGPFGDVAVLKKQATEVTSSSKKGSASDKNKKMVKGVQPTSVPSGPNANVVTPTTTGSKGPDMSVPGIRPENPIRTCGAALAVYRGHVTGTPVWSVAFSPAGYYFASAGADGTARLWTTDRPQPVRLFTGHTSTNVNCVEWHPNCNYIVTGSDDKTVRLWDIQTGRTVRLLTGCSAGINTVRISPGGRYASAADYNGVVHLWDLGNGKKVTEFRAMTTTTNVNNYTKSYTKRNRYSNQQQQRYSNSMIHCLQFSSCSSALATGGDDCCIRIWDVRSDSLRDRPLIHNPIRAYRTKQTVLLDFHYTRRNLLISTGKYIAVSPSFIFS